MRTLYFVRHCEYDLSHGSLPGRLPVELSEKGLVQATKMQQFFADKQISQIYSSAVLRCKQTSQIISFGTIPIVYDKRLLETLSAYQGYWYEGELTRSYFYGYCSELGGESYSDVFLRVKGFYEDVLIHADNVIVCTHGDLLMMLYMLVLGESVSGDAAFESACRRLGYQEMGSVRVVTFHKDSRFELQKLIQF